MTKAQSDAFRAAAATAKLSVTSQQDRGIIDLTRRVGGLVLIGRTQRHRQYGLEFWDWRAAVYLDVDEVQAVQKFIRGSHDLGVYLIEKSRGQMEEGIDAMRCWRRNLRKALHDRRRWHRARQAEVEAEEKLLKKLEFRLISSKARPA